jgi:alkanesulfonate monooxygenase SsuD/methylene tetrahydromethanopterin reductase-like flavin-dependent oxidoreductase (luciferase family)
MNVVTTADQAAAFNFGSQSAADYATRYDRAIEFTDVVKALWNNWQDDALVGDKATGVFIDRARIHRAYHCGGHFQVRGPLNVPRSRQGHPVIVQAGGSTGWNWQRAMPKPFSPPRTRPRIRWPMRRGSARVLSR